MCCEPFLFNLDVAGEFGRYHAVGQDEAHFQGILPLNHRGYHLLSRRRGLTCEIGPEAAEICCRGRAFRNGMIEAEQWLSDKRRVMVKECKLITKDGHRSGRSKRRSRARKDGRLASKSLSIRVRMESGRHYLVVLSLSTYGRANHVPHE